MPTIGASLRHPLITLHLLVSLPLDAASLAYSALSNRPSAAALIVLVAASAASFAAAFPSLSASATYWLLLGVLSSVGLGSGLHTFVLFLGPHIVRVATAALRHGGAAFSAEIEHYGRWPAAWDVAGLADAFSPQYAPDAWLPLATRAPASPLIVSDGTLALALAVAGKVAPAAFFWGIGTAIGELPPYFIAASARKSGKALEELAEVAAARARRKQAFATAAAGETRGTSAATPAGPRGGSRASLLAAAAVSPVVALRAGASGLLDRGKLLVYESIQRWGFWAVLCAASIPNPLFDLAGLTCGHFGVPFLTFFGATLLGKAVIKVSIQVAFVLASVIYGAAALALARARLLPVLPEWTRMAAALDALERAVEAGQHSMCVHGGAAGGGGSRGGGGSCAACCLANFSSSRACAAACTSAIEAGQSWLAQAWGVVMLCMIAFFVLSTLDALVQHRLATLALEARAAAPPSPPSPPQPAAITARRLTPTPRRRSPRRGDAR